MRLLLSCAALLLAGCYDSSFGERDPDEASAPVTTTIAELQALFTGESVPVTGDIVVTGVVTTSDRSQNFYRTLCIEDEGAGMEVMAGIDHLHNDFPTGCRVTLHLRGLSLGKSRGVLQAGRKPAPGSGYPTDYIGSPSAVGAHLVRNGETRTTPRPALHILGELTPAMCGSLVRIDGLHYTPEDLTSGTWAGYKCFCDDAGNQIRTYVRDYASFASEEVPAGECSLTGILQYDDTGGGRFHIKLRDENDCAR